MCEFCGEVERAAALDLGMPVEEVKRVHDAIKAATVRIDQAEREEVFDMLAGLFASGVATVASFDTPDDRPAQLPHTLN